MRPVRPRIDDWSLCLWLAPVGRWSLTSQPRLFAAPAIILVPRPLDAHFQDRGAGRRQRNGQTSDARGVPLAPAGCTL